MKSLHKDHPFVSLNTDWTVRHLDSVPRATALSHAEATPIRCPIAVHGLAGSGSDPIERKVVKKNRVSQRRAAGTRSGSSLRHIKTSI